MARFFTSLISSFTQLFTPERDVDELERTVEELREELRGRYR